MPFVACETFRLFYDDIGQGDAIVWLHGFTLDHRMWRPQIEFFAPDYRLILPDARGHGRSGVTPSGYSRADRVEDLRVLIDALRIERFHLVGLSMGGSTAVGFALKYQDRLRSLALVSTGVAGYGAGKKLDRLDEIGRRQGAGAAKAKWQEWALAWYRTPDREAIGSFMQAMIEEYSGAVWADPLRGKYPREFDLERVHTLTVPTMIAAGEQDRIFLPLAGELHKRIPHSILQVYPEAGHMINLEVPHQLNKDIGLFLESA